MRIYGEPPATTLRTAATVPTATLVVAYLGHHRRAWRWFVWFRYRRIQVTR